MDKFFLQLAELNRAGWSFEISPELNGVTMQVVRAAVAWTLERDIVVGLLDETPVFPLIDWIKLFAPEIEVRKAVAQMHARVFPIPPVRRYSGAGTLTRAAVSGTPRINCAGCQICIGVSRLLI